ncbi:helix-turn-helix transcriptional regulator [Microbacterium oryzae]|uniref:helix-turn-helix domain-containing protein n=1 Tax=Microbacterium oryzae TaxID=743009 RepID=UPI0025B0937E|nr:helix-turn-helix transcriptional regulator [Microbacterium oryzae]MDN3311857.1 helix-turn-helix transcriptional regulator [Microbacterium oryzae]
MADGDLGEARRDVAPRIFDALADERWHDAMATVEANLAELVSFDPVLIRTVADTVPTSAMRRRPRWWALRQYVTHLVAAPEKPPVFPDIDVEVPEQLPPADRVVLLTGRIAFLRSRGLFREAADLADAARDALQAMTAAERAAIRSLLPIVLVQWGVTIAADGDLVRAADVLLEAHTAAEETGNVRMAREAVGELSWVHAILGDGAVADLWLERAARLRARYPDMRFVRAADDLGAAYRASDALDFDRCLRLLDDESTLFEELTLPAAGLRAIVGSRARSTHPVYSLARLQVAVEGTRPGLSEGGLNAAVLAVARGTVLTYQGLHEAALLALQRAPAMHPQAEGLLRTRRASAYLGLGETRRALREVAREDQSRAPRVRVEALVVRATALWREGDRDGAVTAFRTAWETSQANGLRASLAVVPMADLEGLAAASGWSGPLPQPPGERLLMPAADYRYERLTAQQLSVLRAAAEHERLADAAAKLGVSANTAKVHLQAAYRRLGVSDRASAIAEGHRRGLL